MNTRTSEFIMLTANEVDVMGDCEISLDVADATVDITWNPLMPNGTTPCIDSPVYDPATLEVINEIPGNVLVVYNRFEIYNKKHELGSITIFDPLTYFIGDKKIVEGQCNIKTNPNENYLFFLEKEAIDDKGGYIISMVADDIESQIVTNNIKNYVTIKPEFVYTPHEVSYEGGQKEFNRERAYYLHYANIISGKLDGISNLYVLGVDEDIKK